MYPTNYYPLSFFPANYYPPGGVALLSLPAMFSGLLCVLPSSAASLCVRPSVETDELFAGPATAAAMTIQPKPQVRPQW